MLPRKILVNGHTYVRVEIEPELLPPHDDTWDFDQGEVEEGMKRERGDARNEDHAKELVQERLLKDPTYYERAKALRADKIPGGLADNNSPEDYDQDSLVDGISIELEHTNDLAVAMEIAMDHLEEDPEYYIKLKKVEGAATKHKMMTQQQKMVIKRYLRTHKIPKRKRAIKCTKPVWRTIRGKKHKGCWEVTITYLIMNGPHRGRHQAWTRCLGFDRTRRPQIRHVGRPPYFVAVFPPKRKA